MTENPGNRTLIDLLRDQAQHKPHDIAYRFIDGSDDLIHIITYHELDIRARAIARQLQNKMKAGNRVMLLFHSGIEFIAAFFGCIYSHMVAVPAFPPRNQRHLQRFRAIAENAGIDCCLTTESIYQHLVSMGDILPGFSAGAWMPTDAIETATGTEWIPTAIDPHMLAILQYTSGSTGIPKGVMVTHHNFLHNLAFAYRRWGHTPKSKMVSWLPFFHDMGLVAGILQPLYGGFEGILMAPATFLRRPYRWLKAISDYRATTTIAPNFAYQLCVDKISMAEKSTLDLSCLRLAINGAEPVYHETLKQFTAAFESCGLSAQAPTPGYGMAEATLVVSVGDGKNCYRHKQVDPAALEQHHVELSASPDAKSIVGCGWGSEDQEILIVNPVSGCVCLPQEVGEVWMRGPSITQGYWQRPEDNIVVFAAITADTREGPYFRSGDLGFIEDGHLYITGRLKDLIIIHGANHYPQDIEATVTGCHEAFRHQYNAAFSITRGDQEFLVVVQEINRHSHLDFKKVIEQVKDAIMDTHGIPLHAFIGVTANALPKTSSGKIQRNLCRTAYLNAEFKISYEWHREQHPPPDAIRISADEGYKTPLDSISDLVGQREAFRTWISARLAACLHLSQPAVVGNIPFRQLGLDSVRALILTGEIESYLKQTLSASLLYDFPSVDELVAHFFTPSPAPRSGNSYKAPQPAAPIAVIGLDCRFPEANDAIAFWEVLAHGVDAVRPVPYDRWDSGECGDAMGKNAAKMRSRWGGFIADLNAFDAQFFALSPREAATMDPQQRLVLEVTWRALAQAGIQPDALAGTATGVFIGASSFDHTLEVLSQPDEIDAYGGTGSAHSIIANRVSYFLDLHGPSMVIDTACSSSLVAVHMACESLRRGECVLALTGGVNVLLRPEMFIALSQAQMMAADGRCKTFSEEADGYVRGEGCGVVILKRLDDAQREGDKILAVIRGSAINQDGRSNGLTAPNGPAQEAVITQALLQSGIQPAEISYVECHGTGTKLGDPQEIVALNNVLAQKRRNGDPCMIGSVKTNIGHLESAAGIAGLIKVVLALHHHQIPPHLHAEKISHLLHLERTPFIIPSHLMAWPKKDFPQFAGVSSFGFGGANAHVILSSTPITSAIRPSPINGKSGNTTIKNPQPAEAYLSKRQKAIVSGVQHASIELGGRLEYAGLKAAEEGLHHLQPDRFLNYMECVNQLSWCYQYQALHQLKLTPATTMEQQPHDLIKVKMNQPVSQRIIRRWQENMENSPFRKLFTVDNLLTMENIEISRQTWEGNLIKLGVALPDMAILGKLVLSAGQKLEKFLTGSINPMEILFPEGSSTQLEALYADSSLGRYFNQILVSLVKTHVESFTSAPHCRILEIGAGTGATTAAILPILSASNTTYVFSDLGEVFIHRARQRFAHYDFVDYQLLDISDDEGISLRCEEPFDIIIAANVIHATRHIPRSIDNIRRMLKPRGLLLIWEATEPQLWYDITFGLLEGWHLSTDFRRIQGHPLMNPTQWASRLSAAGFASPIFLPEKNSSSYGLGQHIIATTKLVVNDTTPAPAMSVLQAPCSMTAFDPSLQSITAKSLYEYTWHEKNISSTDGSNQIPAKSWLILADDGEVARQLAQTIINQGGYPILVFLGMNSDKKLPGVKHHCLSAINADTFEQLFNHLMDADTPPIHAIIHLWSLNCSAPVDSSLTELHRALNESCLSTINMLQALLRHALKGSGLRLWLVTRASQAVISADRIEGIFYAPLWGLGRTIAVEHPELWGGLIDLDSERLDDEGETLYREITAEYQEDQISWRQRKRWVGRFRRLDKAPAPRSSLPLCRSDCTYLITGGLGGMGLLSAQWLIAQGARRLLLLGHNPLPPRHEWRDLSADHPAFNKIRAISGLEAQGAAIHTGCFDLGKWDESNKFFSRFHAENYPPIKGIIHAAGISDDQNLNHLTADQFYRVLNPKVSGAWIIHSLFKDTLDFIIFFSSAAALIPAPGGANYTAANTFLDALSHYRRSRSSCGLTVNWGPVDNAGLAANEQRRQLLQFRGVTPISSQPGFQSLEYALKQNWAHYCMIDVNWEILLNTLPTRLANYCFKDFINSGNMNHRAEFHSQLVPESVDSDSSITTSPDIKNHISNIIRSAMMAEAGALSEDHSLVEMGFDSIMAIQLVNEIENHYAATFSAQDVMALKLDEIVASIHEQTHYQSD